MNPLFVDNTSILPFKSALVVLWSVCNNEGIKNSTTHSWWCSVKYSSNRCFFCAPVLGHVVLVGYGAWDAIERAVVTRLDKVRFTKLQFLLRQYVVSKARNVTTKTTLEKVMKRLTLRRFSRYMIFDEKETLTWE